jgi:hypothetical protein
VLRATCYVLRCYGATCLVPRAMCCVLRPARPARRTWHAALLLEARSTQHVARGSKLKPRAERGRKWPPDGRTEPGTVERDRLHERARHVRGALFRPQRERQVLGVEPPLSPDKRRPGTLSKPCAAGTRREAIQNRAVLCSGPGPVQFRGSAERRIGGTKSRVAESQGRGVRGFVGSPFGGPAVRNSHRGDTSHPARRTRHVARST